MSQIEAKINSPTQQAACAIGDWIEEKEKHLDHVHYGCSWQIRGDKVFHVCYEQKTEWELK